MVTQIIFFLLELVQMAVKKAKYITIWNMVDCSLFLIYVVYFCFRVGNTDKLLPRNNGIDEQGNKLSVQNVTFYVLIHMTILLLSSLKLLNFLRVFASFGQFVELLQNVMRDVSVFTVFFFYWVGLNGYLLDIMGIDFDLEDYENIGRTF